MAKKQVSVMIEDSGYEVAAHSAKIMAAIKQATADGWQPGQDLPVIVTSLINEAPAIITSALNIAADVKESPLLFAKGVNLGAYDMVEVFIPVPAVQ